MISTDIRKVIAGPEVVETISDYLGQLSASEHVADRLLGFMNQQIGWEISLPGGRGVGSVAPFNPELSWTDQQVWRWDIEYPQGKYTIGHSVRNRLFPSRIETGIIGETTWGATPLYIVCLGSLVQSIRLPS
ncbi:MAG: hypothetical protein WBP26_01825 [Candidatus Saccharimonadales bacterium]